MSYYPIFGGHLGTLGAVVIVALGLLLLLGWTSKTSPETRNLLQGKENTVLFLSTANHGQINVHLATVQALLERHPSITIHFASAQAVAKSLDRIVASVRKSKTTAGDVIFHELAGLEPMEAVMRRQFGDEVMRHFRHPPNAKGASQFYKIAQVSMSPWNCQEFVSLYNATLEIIDAVDPAVVVLDFAFRPAIDATRKRQRMHTFLTPTALVDMLPMIQPSINVLWKYPIVGTDFPFPIPWKNIPENIYVALRAILSFELMGDLAETKRAIAAQGIDDAFGSLSTTASWIMPSMPEASTPVDPVPDNVMCTGPIVLGLTPAIDQDLVLVEWLQRAPTVLVCLGSLFQYDKERTAIMAHAIQILLDHTDVQVVWKFGQADMLDDAKSYLQSYAEQGRVQIHQWLTVNPVSLLETGNVVASVHHGGANCHYEALSAGVPQVVVPMWTDLYNYAQRVENVGIGVYATRGTAPEWTVEGLSDAFLKVVDGGEASVRMREKARRLGDIARKDPGRYAAARQVAKLAGERNLDKIDYSTFAQ